MDQSKLENSCGVDMSEVDTAEINRVNKLAREETAKKDAERAATGAEEFALKAEEEATQAEEVAARAEGAATRAEKPRTKRKRKRLQWLNSNMQRHTWDP